MQSLHILTCSLLFFSFGISDVLGDKQVYIWYKLQCLDCVADKQLFLRP